MVVFIVVIVGAVAILAAVAYLSYYADKKRREAFAMLARRKGWSYVEQDNRWTEAFGGSPFGEGHAREASNVVTGQCDGRGFVSFDYHYRTTEAGLNSQGRPTNREVSHDYGVVAIDAGLPMPELEVIPEGMFGRFLGRVSGRDIELESEEFNRAFTVHCPDRKFASDVLHPQMMEFLLTRRDTSFRFDGHWVLTAEEGRVPIQSVEPRLGVVDAVLDRVPEFVWQNLKGGV